MFLISYWIIIFALEYFDGFFGYLVNFFLCQRVTLRVYLEPFLAQPISMPEKVETCASLKKSLQSELLVPTSAVLVLMKLGQHRKTDVVNWKTNEWCSCQV